MSIQTINANAVIIIDGNHFKANANGMWNLTDIWRTLGLPDNKRPSQWNNMEAKALRSCVEISTQGKGNQSYVIGSKFATLQYAGWVSFNFNRMVYAAFEAVLAMPEVAAVVANKMVELGHIAEAEQLERLSNVDRDYAHEQMKQWRDKTTNQARAKAVMAGHLTLTQAKNQGLSGVWLRRCVEALSAQGGDI